MQGTRWLISLFVAGALSACGDEVESQDAAQVDAMVRDATLDMALPDRAFPDGALPDGQIPDTQTPDALAPDGGARDGQIPDGAFDLGPDMATALECEAAEDCDDDNPCTVDTCLDFQCQHDTQEGCCQNDADCGEGGHCLEAGTCAESATPGAVVITEIMADPEAVEDMVGEWIEIQNVSDASVLLDGWTLAGGAGERHLIEPADPLLIPAGGVVVLGREALSGLNGQVSVSYVYDAFSLVNGGDRVELIDALGNSIDVVEYDATFPLESGASLSLSADRRATDTNDRADAWCAGQAPWAVGADRGSPGVANPLCPGGDATADWCRFQAPMALEIQAGERFQAYGRLFEAEVTDRTGLNDPEPRIVAQAGMGPDGTDPTADLNWIWTDGTPNPGWDDVAEPGNDEYWAEVVAPMPGRWDLAFRFSLDAGETWTVCDGAAGVGMDGAEDGYQPENAGDLTVTPGPCLPNPCNEPPEAGGCSDAFTANGFEIPGVCETVEGVAECTYEPTGMVDCREVGDQVCVNGACADGEPRPNAGEIIFTEVMFDPHGPLADDDAEWVEVHNISDRRLRLDGCIFADARSESVIERVVIDAGAAVVFARNNDPEGTGVNAVHVFDFALNNGEEILTLRCGEQVVDVLNYDTGADFPGERQHTISLDPGAYDAMANDDGGRWCLGEESYWDAPLIPDSQHFGTPGRINPPCPHSDTDLDWCRLQFPLDLETDAASVIEVYAHLFEAGLTDQTPQNDADLRLLAQVGYGAPGSLPNDDWTWFEAAGNPEWDAIMADEPGNDEYVGDLTVPAAGAYDFAARFSLDGGESWLNCDRAAGPGSDGAEDGYQPENAGHMLSLASPCEVAHCAELPAPRCDGDQTLIEATVATGCVVDDGSAVCQYDEIITDCTIDGAHCAHGACVDPASVPLAGEVIFTEFMADPHDGLSDADAEWFEVQNISGHTVTLHGCTIADAGDSDDIIGVLLVPGAVALFAREADPALNGGLEPDALFNFSLNNGAETLTLACGDVVDSVSWDGEFPLARRRATQLDPSTLDGMANDDGINWCLSASIYYAVEGSEHQGTPGVVNPPCPVPDNSDTVDWCRLQFPLDPLAGSGSTLMVYGRVFEAGITDRGDGPDPDPLLVGQAGYGPVGSMPDEAWTWVPASLNPGWSAMMAGEPGHDEYIAALIVPEPGEYAFAFRFARGGGAYLNCDRAAGPGSDGAEDGYQPENAGHLTSEPGPCALAACDMPPASECADEVMVTEYLAPGRCAVIDNLAECTYEAVQIDCALDGGRCADGACVGGAETPAVGEVIFTEIMYNPNGSLQDSDAEWFEIYNQALEPRSLRGCTIGDLASEEPVDALLLAAGGYALFARSDDVETNGGLIPDGIFGFTLNNGGETLSLRCAGQIIDQVSYDNGPDFPEAIQASIKLDPGAYGAVANDLGANWCQSELPYYQDEMGEVHTGTPGAAHPPCPERDPCEGVVCDMSPADACEGNERVEFAAGECRVIGELPECHYPVSLRFDCATLEQLCVEGACAAPEMPVPEVGDVVITELMYDPHFALGDASAEFIEIYNRTAGALGLGDCELSDSGSATRLEAGLVIEPGEYLVFTRTDDVALNGGIEAAGIFDFSLNNGGDTISLTCAGALIDVVAYTDDPPFPDGRAASISLNPDTLDPALNDGGVYWCLGVDPYFVDPDGDPAQDNLGTPGISNSACPEIDVTVDWCRLQFPAEIELAAGEPLTSYGWLYEEGLTTLTPGVDRYDLLIAQMGYGPNGSEPTDEMWTWADGVPNPNWDGDAAGEPNNDEYQATIELLEPGIYDLAWRMSLDGGLTWVYCDTAAGLSDGYTPADAGELTVTP